MKHHALAVLSQEAYADKTHWVDSGTEATFTLTGGVQVLAFRGTSFDGKDILRDLRFLPWHSRRLGAWCHRGFLTGVTAFMRGTSFLGDIDPHKPLILTGHSLGGALAVGVGAFLTILGRRPAEIVTYGAPAFGYGHAVGRWLRAVEITQYVHGVDVVPTLPCLGRHVAKLTRLPAEDEDLFLNHRIADYVAALKPAMSAKPGGAS